MGKKMVDGSQKKIEGDRKKEELKYSSGKINLGESTGYGDKQGEDCDPKQKIGTKFSHNLSLP